MDIDNLKQISQQSYDIALQKANALKKADSDQIVVYENHIFKADANTICLVRTLSESKSTCIILDTNNNPCEIKDSKSFLEILLQKNQASLNTYHQLYQKIKSKRA